MGLPTPGSANASGAGEQGDAAVSTTIFDLAAEKLEMHSDLDKLEARGTLRLALKAAGLDANTLTVTQLEVVLEKIMPGELERRGVWNPQKVCRAVATEVKAEAGDVDSASTSDAETVFRRLGGS
jgi:hypothetical protein